MSEEQAPHTARPRRSLMAPIMVAALSVIVLGGMGLVVFDVAEHITKRMDEQKDIEHATSTTIATHEREAIQAGLVRLLGGRIDDVNYELRQIVLNVDPLGAGTWYVVSVPAVASIQTAVFDANEEHGLSPSDLEDWRADGSAVLGEMVAGLFETTLFEDLNKGDAVDVVFGERLNPTHHEVLVATEVTRF